MNEWKDVQILFSEYKEPEEICRLRTEYSMKWYIRKAVSNKRLYYGFSFVGMLCPLVNVVLASSRGKEDYSMAIVILSSITSLTASLLAITNARLKWENYRSAAEFLKREYTLFQARVGVYGEEHRVSAYLNTTEAFMNKVHADWQKTFKKDKGKKKAKNKNTMPADYIRGI